MLGGMRQHARQLGALLLCVGVLAYPALAQPDLPPALLNEILTSPEGRSLLEVYRALQRDYLYTADREAILHGALVGLIAALDDPYVRYLDPQQVEEERRNARAPAEVSRELFGEVVHIKVASFDHEGVGAAVGALMEASARDGANRVILDLRGNGGGLVLGGLQVLDLFLAEGVLAYRVGRTSVVPLGFANPRAYNWPMVVLIDGETASTAEIVAGALQVYRRAALYGNPSAGKGVGQTTLPLPNGGQLRLVTFFWTLPDERSIDQVGLTPDVYTPAVFTSVDPAALAPVLTVRDSDPLLALAIEAIRTQPPYAVDALPPVATEDQEDSPVGRP
jgi:C-terminal processing protease CtpA/Prc